MLTMCGSEICTMMVLEMGGMREFVDIFGVFEVKELNVFGGDWFRF